MASSRDFFARFRRKREIAALPIEAHPNEKQQKMLQITKPKNEEFRIQKPKSEENRSFWPKKDENRGGFRRSISLRLPQKERFEPSKKVNRSVSALPSNYKSASKVVPYLTRAWQIRWDYG